MGTVSRIGSTDALNANTYMTTGIPAQRHRVLVALLWLSIASWGVGLGAKVFDLVVLGASWGAHPPESLVLMPYGKSYPVNPGDFFQPLSVLLMVGSVGSLVAGWSGAPFLKRWLWAPVLALVVIWVLTPLVFWPLINGLYDAARGKGSLSAGQAAELSHQWFVWDWLRVGLIAAGFIAQACAITELLSPRRAEGSG